jgi:hypothetical protein
MPIGLILMAASLAGGIMSSGGRKVIDPEWLKQHFGAAAVTEEMTTLFNQYINSPAGQDIMANAASQGSQMETALRSNTAASGMGAGEGASSGASIFSDSAAGGATKALTRSAEAGIMSQASSQAAQIVNARMQAYMGQSALNDPTQMQKIGAAIGQAAGVGAMMLPQGQKSTTSDTKALSLLAPSQPSTNQIIGGVDSSNPMLARMQSATDMGAVQQPTGTSRFLAAMGYRHESPTFSTRYF